MTPDCKKYFYDKSLIDYKKLAPKKNMAEIEPDSNVVNAASNLSFYSSDTWVYENEKPENGGILYDGISASDPSSLVNCVILPVTSVVLT